MSALDDININNSEKEKMSAFEKRKACRMEILGILGGKMIATVILCGRLSNFKSFCFMSNQCCYEIDLVVV